MSKEIDSRVVQIEFDNAQFESETKQSMSTLDKLKSALQFNKSTDGFEKVQQSINKTNFTPIAKAIEDTKSRFSALEVMGVTALFNITNMAIRTGKNIVNALAIKPITSGFREYELKMDSIKTIIASTGESLSSVNKYLDELNHYADMTIYTFADMTASIGKFTNAGVSLKDATAAIQGISNVAAVSGANANEASRAMYNFSQALAAGSVKYTDWRSIELANMGTLEFKQQLIDSAVAMGTLTEASDGMYKTLKGNTMNAVKNFNDTLTEGWMTSEVLVETLKRYSDETTEIGKKAFAAAMNITKFSQLYDVLQESAQSGWTETWELILGDADEAKELFTGIFIALDGVLSKFHEGRNALLRGWKEGGGRDDVIQSFKNLWAAAESITKPINEAFRNIFPSETAKSLIEISKHFKDLTNSLKISDSTADKLKRTFQGLFSAIDIIKMGITTFFKITSKVISEVIYHMTGLSGGILSVTAAIGDFITGIRNAIKNSEFLKTTFNGIIYIITKVSDTISLVGSKIKEVFDNIKNVDTKPFNKLEKVSESMTPKIEKLSGVFGSFIKTIGKLFEWAAPIFSNIGMIFSNVFNVLAEGISKYTKGMSLSNILDNLNTVLKTLNLALMLKVGTTIQKFFEGLSGKMKIDMSSTGLLDNIKNVLNDVQESLQAFQLSLNAKTLTAIAKAIVTLAIALVVLSLIDPDRLQGALLGISVLFTELTIAMVVLNKTMGGINIVKIGTQMIALSTAILILSVALKTLGKLDWNEIGKGLISIGALITMLTIASQSFASSSKNMKKAAPGLITFSIALVILTKAVKNLGEIDTKQLIKGISSLAVMITTVTIAINSMRSPKRILSMSVAMIAFASAMRIFASSVKELGSVRWQELVKGIGGLSAIFLGLGVFLNSMPSGKKIISTSVGMVIMASAILLLTKSVEKMGSLSKNQLIKGFLALGSALTAMSVALRLMPNSGSLLRMGASFILLATAMNMLIKPIKELGTMRWQDLTKGMLAFIISITTMSVALSSIKTNVSGAIGLIAMATAMRILTPALESLGAMSIGQIAKSLIVLGGSIAILGGSAAILSALIIPMLGISAALALFGVAIAGIGGGILMLSIGLTSLAGLGVAAATGITLSLSAVISLIPLLFKKIGEGLIELISTIGNSASAIGLALINIGSVLLDGFIVLIPKVTSTLLILLSSIINMITENLSMFVQSGMDIINAILNGISENIGSITTKGIEIVTSFIGAVSQNVDSLISSGADLIISFISGIGSKTGDILQAGADLMIDFINGAAAAIESNQDSLLSAVTNLAGAVVGAFTAGFNLAIEGVKTIGGYIGDGLKKLLGMDSKDSAADSDFRKAGESSGKAYAEGVESSKKIVEDALKSLIGDSATFAGTLKEDYSGLGKTIGDEISKGITDSNKTITQALSDLGDTIKTKMSDYNNSYIEIGKSMGSYLGEGLTESQSIINDAMLTLITNINSGIATLTQSQQGFLTIGLQIGMSISNGMMSSIGSIQSSISSLMNMIIQSTASSTGAFRNIGVLMITGFKMGLLSQNATIISSITGVLLLLVSSIQSNVPKFKSMGLLLMSNLAVGISGASGLVRSSVVKATSGLSQAVNSQRSVFVSVGYNLMVGLANGITSARYMVAARAAAVASSAAKAAARALDERSPSRVGHGIGAYFSVGMANGIIAFGKAVYTAASNVAENAKTGIQSAIDLVSDFVDSDMNVTPVITPVLDLSNIKDDMKLFDSTVSSDYANTISASKNLDNENLQNTGMSEGSVYSFTQNNYSPKSLDRYEIYRQTKRQLKMVKGM